MWTNGPVFDSRHTPAFSRGHHYYSYYPYETGNIFRSVK